MKPQTQKLIEDVLEVITVAESLGESREEREAAAEAIAEDEEGTVSEKYHVQNPGALAAWIGRKKYGKEKFQKMAAAGHKHEGDEAAADVQEQDMADEQDMAERKPKLGSGKRFALLKKKLAARESVETETTASVAEDGNYWIAGATKRKGLLHKKLGIPMGKDIPVSKEKAAAKKGGVLGKEANLALTLRKFHHKK